MTAITEPRARRTWTPRLVAGLSATTMTLVPDAAWAHPGIAGHAHGFVYGFAHPFSGMDHLLAMIAVGLFAAQLGGRALWLLPLTFISTMTLAGIAGAFGVSLPFVELGLSLSVVALGLAIALQLSIPIFIAMVAVGFFAVFHGHAHGAEMPESVAGLFYGLGFICATACLHGIGIGLGIAVGRAGKIHGPQIAQISGAAISFAGAIILISS